MNNNILNLIKGSVINEEESQIDKLYRIFWSNILIQFIENPNKEDLILLLQKKYDNNYIMSYYGNNGLIEKKLNITDKELENLLNLLLIDGFEVTNNYIKISKNKIIEYSNKEIFRKRIKKPITPFSETRRSK